MRNSPPFTNILVPWWKDSTYSKTVQTVWMSVWRWQASFILFIQSRKCWITWALDWKGYQIHYSDSISRYSYHHFQLHLTVSYFLSMAMYEKHWKAGSGFSGRWHPAASALRCANSCPSRSNSMLHRSWQLWEAPGYVFSWQKWQVFLNMPWKIDPYSWMKKKVRIQSQTYIHSLFNAIWKERVKSAHQTLPTVFVMKMKHIQQIPFISLRREYTPENWHDIGKSPFSIGSTSSFMAGFPLSC